MCSRGNTRNTGTLQVHYKVQYKYTTSTLQLHNKNTTSTLQVRYKYTTTTITMRGHTYITNILAHVYHTHFNYRLFELAVSTTLDVHTGLNYVLAW